MAKAHIISGILTAFVLVMLAVAGPASAWTASLLIPDSEIAQGEKVEFVVEVDLTQEEFNNLDKLVLNLAGPENYTCEFDVEGNKLIACEGMDIEKISAFNFSFGYGYGYGSGVLAFNISLNSNNLEVGNYSSEIVVVADGNEDAEAGDDFEILDTHTDKVTLCHVPPGNPGNAHTILVDESSVEAHLKNHGDYLGECVEFSAGGQSAGNNGKIKKNHS